jgi:hypothetical protein
VTKVTSWVEHIIPSPEDGSETIPVEGIFSDGGLGNSPAVSFAEEIRQRWAEFNQAKTSEWSRQIRRS